MKINPRQLSRLSQQALIKPSLKRILLSSEISTIMIIHQILVIDDEDDLRNLVQTCLELMAGWQVLTASSGNEGLSKAQTEQPDAILLDMMMPEMDGLKTLQHLRSHSTTKDIPVILLTAKGRSTDQSQFAQLDICGVISKPFDPRKLMTQIVSALSHSKNRA